MGDNYLKIPSLVYNLVTLFPALFLGIQCIKTEFADDKKAYIETKRARKYKVISWCYLSLIALMIIGKIFLRFEWINQLAPER